VTPAVTPAESVDVTPSVREDVSAASRKSLTITTTTKSKLTTKGKKALAMIERETAARFEAALADQWVNDAGKWVNRLKENHGKCVRTISEVESAIKEQRIKTTPAQYAEQIWKEFK